MHKRNVSAKYEPSNPGVVGTRALKQRTVPIPKPALVHSRALKEWQIHTRKIRSWRHQCLRHAIPLTNQQWTWKSSQRLFKNLPSCHHSWINTSTHRTKWYRWQHGWFVLGEVPSLTPAHIPDIRSKEFRRLPQRPQRPRVRQPYIYHCSKH